MSKERLHVPRVDRRVRRRDRRASVGSFYTTPTTRPPAPGRGHLVDPGGRRGARAALRRHRSEPRRADGPARRLDPRDRLPRRARSSGRRSSPIPTCSATANPPARTPTSARRRTSGRSDGRDLVGAGDKGGTFHALDRETGEVVWETQLTPGSVFGGEIGSAAFVDGMLIATSNVGDPETNAPTDVTEVFGLDPATGDDPVDVRGAAGQDLRAGERRPRRRVRRHRPRAAGRARHRRPVDELWSYDAPGQDGVRAVDRRRPGAAGATASSSSARPGAGGVISFTVGGLTRCDVAADRATRPRIAACVVVLLLACSSEGGRRRATRQRRPSDGARSRLPTARVRPRGATCGPPSPPGYSDQTIMSGGVERAYQLDVPAGYDGTTAASDRARAPRAHRQLHVRAGDVGLRPDGRDLRLHRRRAVRAARTAPRRTGTRRPSNDNYDVAVHRRAPRPPRGDALRRHRAGVLDRHVERRADVRRCWRAAFPSASPRSRRLPGSSSSSRATARRSRSSRSTAPRTRSSRTPVAG